jgi:hypothetical protein
MRGSDLRRRGAPGMAPIGNSRLAAGRSSPEPGCHHPRHAAFAVAKEATLAAMVVGNGRLTPGDRGEILAAALRALHADRAPRA